MNTWIRFTGEVNIFLRVVLYLLLGSYKPPLTIKELDNTIIHKISDKEIITDYFGGDNSTKTTQFNLDNLLIPNHF